MADHGHPLSRRWRPLGVATAIAAAAILACTTDTAIGPRGVDSLYVSPETATVVITDSLGLAAVAIDASGKAYVNLDASWASDNPSVASVTGRGLVHAVAPGAATITAGAGGRSATARITVTPKPSFATSRDSVGVSGIANGPAPAPDTILITNGGGSSLVVSMDSTTYGPGASGWLGTALSAAVAPDTLVLTVRDSGLALGTYSAAIFLSAPKASNSPKRIPVTLTLGTGAASQVAVSAGAGQSAAVHTALATPIAVIVHDAYGNPVAGDTVTFAANSGNGSLSATQKVTGVDGKTPGVTWTLGTLVGKDTVTATASGAGVSGNPVIFLAAAVHGPAFSIFPVTADTPSVTVNTMVPVARAVRVTDFYLNPVDSVAVTFAVQGGGGSVSGANQTTDSTGVARVGSWTLGTQRGANDLAATASGLSGSPVNFIALGTSDVPATIAKTGGDAQTDTVAATLATPYTVTVTDQYANPVPGVTVTWGVSGGGSITPSSVTDNSGVASAIRVLGTTAGSPGATATLNGVSGSPVSFGATATHGAAVALLKAAGDSQSAIVDSAVPVAPSAKVTDQFGNPVSGIAVTFAVVAGGGVVTPTSAINTSGLGRATVTNWHLGPTTGQNRLRATALGGDSVIFVATGISGAAKNLVYVSGDAQSDTIGAKLAPLVVQVTDNLSNGVSGVTVNWIASGATLSSTTSITDAGGFAVDTLTLGSVAGPGSATASVGGLTGSPLPFTLTIQHGNPSLMSASAGGAQAATVHTNAPTAPRVLVTDRAGNPISGIVVTYTPSSSASGQVTGATPATDAGGLAAVTSWTLDSIAGTDTLVATATSLPTVQFVDTAKAGAVDAAKSSVAAGTDSITACSTACSAGTTASTITVTARDGYGNAVPNAGVTPAATGTANGFAPASGTTDAGGVFTTGFNSTKAESKTISATAGGVGVTQTAGVVVRPTAVSLATSTIAAVQTSITACSTACSTGGGTASTINTTVRDTFSNPIPNDSIQSFFVYGTGYNLNPATGHTNGAGVFSSTFNATGARVDSIYAFVYNVGYVANTTPTIVTIGPAAPASIAVNSGGSQTARVSTNVASAPTFVVKDAFGNHVGSGISVSFSAAGGGSVSPASAFTNASGVASTTSWSLGSSGTENGNGTFTNTLTASATGAGSVGASGFGIYTFSGDVNFVIGTGAGSTCAGCHSWTRNPNTIVGIGSQSGGSCPGYRYVVADSAGFSLIYEKVNWPAPCGVNMPQGGSQLSITQLKILRAWINNGAQDN